MIDHNATIKKTEDDRFHLTIRDGFRQIDEEIDGPKLLAMLVRETLINARGEVIAAEDILYRLDSEAVGYEVVIGIKDRAA